MERAIRLFRLLTIVFAGVLLAACGAEDDGDEDAPDAQPTIAVNQEATGTPAIFSEDEATQAPGLADSDLSTPDVATPAADDAAGVSTPSPATAEPVTDLLPSETGDDVATPAGGGAATPDAGIGDEDSDTAGTVNGDGTTGAPVDLGSTPAADDATPVSVATPAATPEAAQGEPLTVTGCEVADVPPFTGEQSTYVVTVDVNFRVGPGTDCELAFDQPIGEFQVVEVIGGPVIREDDGSEWVQIEALGTVGWVAFEFIEPAGE